MPQETRAGRSPGYTPSSFAGEVVAAGRRVIRAEASAVAALEARLGEAFVAAVAAILEAGGRVVVSGVGKSGIVGRKIAATLTSTGCPAVFLHPIEALHGDLGIVERRDVAILVSKSGESVELRGLLAHFARLGITVIALVGRPDSTLGRAATIRIDCGVQEEACSLDLVPTSSTTAALAMGDALAVALLEQRGFGAEDVVRFHPGGSLGRKLLLRVRDVMLTEDLPLLDHDATLREAIVVLARRRGIAVVVDAASRILGLLTAGDLTRILEGGASPLELLVGGVMTREPLTATADQLASAVVGIMERRGVMAMPVLDERRAVVGVVHLHDLLRAGAV